MLIRFNTNFDGVYLLRTYTPHEAVRIYKKKLIDRGYNTDLIFGDLKDFGDLPQEDFEEAICEYRTQRHHNVDYISCNTIIYDAIVGVIYDELLKQVNLVSRQHLRQMFVKGELQYD